MPAKPAKEEYEVIWLVRRLFRALGQKSNELLEDMGISAADRAVMEFLYPDKQLSVPEIAERYQVSRQHVQVTVNALLKHGLLVTRENPKHKRSSLIALNAKGRKLFARIRRDENGVISELFAPVTRNDVRVTRQTLETLFDQLSKESEKEQRK